MDKNIALWISGIFGSGIGKIFGIGFIAMIPIIELRGAIPVAYALGVDWPMAMSMAILGNMIPIPFILLFIDGIFSFMKKHNIMKDLVLRLEKKAVTKSEEVTKYQFWGLAIFVAIPLPGTGGWTGALIASIIKMNKKQAFLSILIGVVIASVIVTILTYGLVGSIV